MSTISQKMAEFTHQLKFEDLPVIPLLGDDGKPGTIAVQLPGPPRPPPPSELVKYPVDVPVNTSKSTTAQPFAFS